ncbi:MAG: cytochrome P450 [Chloroflexota bacterium]
MPKHLPPGPKGLPMIGILHKMWRDPLSFFQDVTQEFGDIVSLDFGNRHALLINDPTLIKYVLQDNNKNYKKSSTVKIVKQVLGKGLATNEGDFWRQQRRLMAPSFHRRQIEKLGDVIVNEAMSVVDRWGKTAVSRDIHAEMMNLTLNINVKTMFGADVGNRADEIGQAWTNILHTFNARSWAMVQTPTWWPSASNRRYLRSLELLDHTVYQFINGKRQIDAPQDDVLSMLLEAVDVDTGERMPDQQVRDEVMTIFLAGHETTAVLLAWTFYLLAQHPDVTQKLRDEAALVCNGRKPTTADLSKLTYTRHVIDEVLRFYPPFWLIYRSPYEADEIGGYDLADNDMVFISPALMHKHPQYWEDPDRFWPERFATEEMVHQPRYAYIPFGGGPRQCIGNNLAIMEAQLILATLIPRFEFGFVEPVMTESAVTLRPKQGLPLSVHPIQQNVRKNMTIPLD